MSDKTDRAKARLAEECLNKEYLIPFEEYLTGICTSDDIADKILDESKTLEGCFEHMREIARKRQKNNCAYIPEAEGLEIIREYYDINLSVKSDVIDITDFL